MTERENLKLYCQNATVTQLQNIIRDERDRARRHGEDSEIGRHAAMFADCAENELDKR